MEELQRLQASAILYCDTWTNLADLARAALPLVLLQGPLWWDEDSACFW